MASEDQADETSKTEPPTGKRLSEARSKGQLAISEEVKHWFSILACLIFLWLFATPISLGMVSGLTPLISKADQFSITGMNALEFTLELFMPAAVPILSLMALLMLLIYLSGFIQVGPYFHPERLAPDLARLNPVAGFNRLFSVQAVISLFKTLAKFIVIAILVFWLLVPEVERSEMLVGMDGTAQMAWVLDFSLSITWAVVIFHLFIAAADWAYIKFDYTKKLRMTKSEVKDEARQSEGDPKVKAKLRQVRLKRSRQRMMAAVPKATVVITNPTHFAVALRYDRDSMGAPVCVAKGLNHLAKRIRELAKESEVPVLENPPLARALYATVEIDDEIPVEHYRAVAEIISFLSRSKAKRLLP